MPDPVQDERRPRWPGEAAVIAVLLVAYDRVADLARVRPSVAVQHGRAVLDLERAMHLAVEGGLVSAVAGHQALGRVLAAYYDLAHAGAVVAVLAGFYLRAPDSYRRARNALVAVNGVGLAVFFAWPVAPPRLLPDAGFVDVVAAAGRWGASAASLHADQFASLPSLHVAWALWVALTVRAATSRRWLRALGGVHVGVTVVVVVVTGNHYLLDVLAGGAVALACWQLAGRRADRPGRVPAALRAGLAPVA